MFKCLLASYHVPGSLQLFTADPFIGCNLPGSIAFTFGRVTQNPSPRLAFPASCSGSDVHGMIHRTPRRSLHQNHLPNWHLKCHYLHFISMSWRFPSPQSSSKDNRVPSPRYLHSSLLHLLIFAQMSVILSLMTLFKIQLYHSPLLALYFSIALTNIWHMCTVFFI